MVGGLEEGYVKWLTGRMTSMGQEEEEEEGEQREAGTRGGVRSITRS
jgi:hypothetical protein